MENVLLATLEQIRKSSGLKSSRDDRSKIGQFLTPVSIARFMASLFNWRQDDVRILDPGAGTGVLFAACVHALLSDRPYPSSIEVVAYETDPAVLPYLKDTMSSCKNVCREAGITFRGTIGEEDFVTAAVTQVEEGLFSADRSLFTHAVLNPPYRKINGQSETRQLLDVAGIEVSNLYAAFVWLSARLLAPGGEIAAITPRSFCNGPYFRRFRIALLDLLRLCRVHVFESRKKAFSDDDVLQENVVFHGVRGGRKPKQITVSSSESTDFEKAIVRTVSYKRVVLPGDRDAFIYLVLNDSDDRVLEKMAHFTTSLHELGLEVSTGRVVDFRARRYLRSQPVKGSVPLIYPCHFEDGFVRWPVESKKKPNAILSSDRTRDLLVSSEYYVLTKRFTAKEERRRVVAAIYDPQRIDARVVGFENHLNYFHARGAGLSPNLARGLAAYLNSSLFDHYFRLFSGHTQVNAIDLRKVRYPSCHDLLRLGTRVKSRIPDQDTLDTILEEEFSTHG